MMLPLKGFLPSLKIEIWRPFGFVEFEAIESLPEMERDRRGLEMQPRITIPRMQRMPAAAHLPKCSPWRSTMLGVQVVPRPGLGEM
jgi:hypothetical protein